MEVSVPQYEQHRKMPYGTARWQKRRARQLSEEPLCWMHKARGEVVPAIVADHDPPHKGDLDAFWSGPLRSLCKRCHDSDKQRMEKGGEPKPVFGLDGWPTGGGSISTTKGG